MVARLVPAGEEWMLSGAQHLFRKSAREAMVKTSVSPLPFRRLARRDPAKASEVYRRLLKRPNVSRERDGELLMRHRKPASFARPLLPHVPPAGRAMLEAHGAHAVRMR